MPKTRPPYPPQLRARLVELARTGRTPEELGRQFEPSAQTIRNWLRQADRDDGRRVDGLTTEEREEVRRLRRENKMLREERDILKNSPGRRARPTCWTRNSRREYPRVDPGAVAVCLLVTL